METHLVSLGRVKPDLGALILVRMVYNPLPCLLYLCTTLIDSRYLLKVPLGTTHASVDVCNTSYPESQVTPVEMRGLVTSAHSQRHLTA